MDKPAPLGPGSGLSASWLNAALGLAESGQVRVDGGSGLMATVASWGTAIADRRQPEGWFQVTASAGGGSYTITESVDEAAFTWSAGPRVRTATEVNANATAPVGARLWARRSRSGWIFEWGACS